MRLPFANAAIVEERKLIDYLLNPAHPQGHSKAAFFGQFGFERERPDIFRHALIEAASSASMQEFITPYGTKYVGTGILRAPVGGDVQIVMVWMLRDGLPPPILVTAYPA